MYRKSSRAKLIALENMSTLYNLGLDATRKNDVVLSRRYGDLIYVISMRMRTRIPQVIKRWICKNCRVIMIPGVNAVIRTRRKGRSLRVITRCLVCGYIHRYEFLRCREDETKGTS